MHRVFEGISKGAHKGTLVQYGKAGQSPELSSVRGIGHINGEAARRRMEQLMSNQLRSGNGASGGVLRNIICRLHDGTPPHSQEKATSLDVR